MKKYLLLLLIPSIVLAQFGSGVTQKNIDQINNESGVDIVINPVSSMKLNSLTGDKALVSGSLKEIEESSTTKTQIEYLNTTTSDVQVQIDSKEPILPITTDGDLLYYNSGRAALGIGTIGQLLTVSALGFPSWMDAPISTTLDTKGQLQGFSTVNANVGPCIDDQILVYDAVELTGWKCSDLPTTTPTTTEGDLIVRGATEDERLPIGTNGQLLTSNGTTAGWADAPVSTTLTQKGEIQGFSTVNAPIGPCLNDGEFLVRDDAEATGWKCSSTLSGSLNPITDWVPCGPTVIEASTTNPTKGTVTLDKMWCSRVGDSLKVRAEYIQTSSGTIGSGDYFLMMPTGYQIDLAKVTQDTGIEGGNNGFTLSNHVGTMDINTGNNNGQMHAFVHDSTRIRAGGISSNNAAGNSIGVWGSTFYNMAESDLNFTFHFTVPIQGWTSGTDAIAQNKKLPQAKTGANADQSIPNNSSTPITLNTTKYDNRNMVDLANNKIVIAETGTYTIFPNIVLRNTVSTLPPNNGRCFSGFTVIAGPNTGLSGSFGSWRITTAVNTLWAYQCGYLAWEGELSEGDEVRLQVEHNFGASVELVANDYVSISQKVTNSTIAATLENDHKIGDCKWSLLSTADFTSSHHGGWVRLEGQSVAGSDIDTQFGISTLPDMVGNSAFLRQQGSASGALRAYQADDNKSHQHTIQSYTGAAGATPWAPSVNNLVSTFGAFQSDPSGGAEARPKNIALNFYCRIN